MAEYIAIPKLGMSMTEATLVEWKAEEGSQVGKGDVVLVIETEKTQWEVEAATSGFVHIIVNEEVTAPVSRVVGFIAENKEELETLQKEPVKEIFTTVSEPEEAPQTPPAEKAAEAVAKPEGKRVRISPVARKIAEEHKLDITTIKGTGPDGRIVRQDVEKAIEAGEKAAPVAEVYEGKRVKSVIPLKSMRKAIAEHMHNSLAISAQLTNMGEIDMTEIVSLRNTLLTQEEAIGARITYTDILVLASAKAIEKNPIINASLLDNEIKIWEDINIGVAVAVEGGAEGGLIVPVVRNADQKSLVEINQVIRTLVEKARAGKLLPDDVSGGTFTVTNLGAVGGGWGFGTPIINQPQSAIIGTGSITDRPVVRDGQIVIRPIMTFSLTYDHRVVDGAPAAAFLITLTQILENPGLLLL